MQASAQAVLAVFELRQAYDQVGAMAASALALAADGVNIAPWTPWALLRLPRLGGCRRSRRLSAFDRSEVPT